MIWGNPAPLEKFDAQWGARQRRLASYIETELLLMDQEKVSDEPRREGREPSKADVVRPGASPQFHYRQVRNVGTKKTFIASLRMLIPRTELAHHSGEGGVSEEKLVESALYLIFSTGGPKWRPATLARFQERDADGMRWRTYDLDD